MSELSIPVRIVLGIKRRWHEFMFRPHIIKRQHDEFEVQLSIEDTFGEGWYGSQHGEWPELDWIRRNGIKAGDTVIDCGANHGFTSILFAKFATDAGKVIAVEPVPHNIRLIKKNLEMNGIKNCVIKGVGAGNENAEIEMVDVPNGSMMPSFKGKRITVPVRTLDSLVDGGKVDFLKIDVEGFERHVLEGAQQILASRPRMDLELHVAYYTEKLAEVTAIFDLLPLADYRMSIQMDVDGAIEEWKQGWKEAIPKIAAGEIVHLFLD